MMMNSSYQTFYPFRRSKGSSSRRGNLKLSSAAVIAVSCHNVDVYHADDIETSSFRLISVLILGLKYPFCSKYKI